MPFKSKSQERYFFANRDKLEKQGVDVKEWADASKGMNLPEKVTTKRRSPKHASILHTMAKMHK